MGDAQYSLNHLMHVSGNDTEFMIEILEMFLPQAKLEIEQTSQFIADERWDEAKFSVHHLRSAAGSIGAVKTAASCSDFEDYLSSSADLEKDIRSRLDEFTGTAQMELLEIEAALVKLKNDSHK